MADARQRWFDGSEAQRERGANVMLTLDEKIQYIAQRELATAMATTRAQAGSVIVMNPNNGEILALANWPEFNPNVATTAPAEARLNRSVSVVYEPGSTFKLITLAAAFDQNVITAGRDFRLRTRVDHSQRAIASTITSRFGLLNVGGHSGEIERRGRDQDCAAGWVREFYDYIRAFGFGAQTGVDMPGESRGMSGEGR